MTCQFVAIYNICFSFHLERKCMQVVILQLKEVEVNTCVIYNTTEIKVILEKVSIQI